MRAKVEAARPAILQAPMLSQAELIAVVTGLAEELEQEMGYEHWSEPERDMLALAYKWLGRRVEQYLRAKPS